jgi:hypothetical protein
MYNTLPGAREPWRDPVMLVEGEMGTDNPTLADFPFCSNIDN